MATKKIDHSSAVKAAYEYLLKVSPDSKSYTNFSLEEIQTDENGDYLITLSYEIAGELGFDRKKVYKDFKVEMSGEVSWMKIRKI